MNLNRTAALRWLAPLALAASAMGQTQPSRHHLADPIPVAGPGRWDYVLSDGANHLLYVPRTTHTQVVDEQTGKIVADMDGQKTNHGVAIAPAAGRGFITDGAGAIHIFDLKTYKVLGSIKAPDDADGIIYDAGTNKVLVSCGDSSVVAIVDPQVDPASGQVEATVDLGGKPEFLAADGKGRAYINLENKDQIAVVDIAAKKVLDHWPVAPAGAPVGMAIDPATRRLYIGCRKPAKMIVMNADDGKIIADLPIGKGCDACAFDNGVAYASCGDGTVTVVGDVDGKPAVLETITTAQGARTMAVDPADHTLYLPTAEFGPAVAGQRRPSMKEGTFKILVVKKN